MARYWYELAAKQNHKSAYNNLGIIYKNGYSVPVDYTKAFELFKKAADLGNEIGMANLGECYIYGRGVSVDIGKGFDLLQKSAKLGSAYAVTVLKRFNIDFDKDKGFSAITQ